MERTATPAWYWITLAFFAGILAVLYSTLTFERLEVFKMLLASFFPLALLILAVLGTIVFGLATPTEAAAIGSFGGFIARRRVSCDQKSPAERNRLFKIWAPFWAAFMISVVWFILWQSEVLDSGPPAWLGAISVTAIGVWCVIATFQANGRRGKGVRVPYGENLGDGVLAIRRLGHLLGGVCASGRSGNHRKWVLSLSLTPVQFMLLSQFIIFILGWPLEWTEIIVIFMPIFIPLLPKFGIDPLFFGLLVALNLQTAFLSPPVAMAAFYFRACRHRM